MTDDTWRDKEDKRETVRFHLGRIGISINAGDQLPGPEPTPAKPLPPAEKAWPQAFVKTPGGVVISTTLAAKLHYRPTVAQEAPPAPTTGEEQSYEEMRHGN